jgi:hypothetical protein
MPITPPPEDRDRLRAEQERAEAERRARIRAEIWGQPAGTSPPADPEPGSRPAESEPTSTQDGAQELAAAQEPTSSGTDPQAPAEPPITRGESEQARRANGAEEAPLDLPSDLGEWDAGLDRDPIPPRGWLLGNTFCRGFVSSLMAGGGTGKTALRIAQALALATGLRLTDEHVFRRSRVLYVSLEDDRDELRRRVQAAMKHHHVDLAHIRGHLYLATPALGLKLASIEAGTFKAGDLGAKLKAAIELQRIDVVILDPFIKSHGVGENDNTAIDMVMAILAGIAARWKVAIDVPHHVAKGATEPGNADRGRGASSHKDACRLAYTLTTMSAEEANGFGIGEAERRSLIRMDPAKVNLAPAASATWFRLVGVPLGNSTAEYPSGDEVQTVEPWNPPALFAGLSTPLLNEILTDIDNGLPGGRRYSAAAAATDRAAWKVIAVRVPGMPEKRARAIIKTWVEEGLLVEEAYDDPTRRTSVKGLRVVQAKRPS